ncbi:MAG: hypothetical protein ABI365_04475 [Lysobacteraceae bacterium]
MKTFQILAAIGALALAVCSADATVRSSTLTVSITIASPCGASANTMSAGTGRSAARPSNAVTVTCDKPATPYSVGLFAAPATRSQIAPDPIVSIQHDDELDAYADMPTATVTF